MFKTDNFTKNLKIYMVGGAVRDHLLGMKIKDKDWVVVGSSPTEMFERGFIPVGKNFPVFLHPKTKEEYALARTERKYGIGYKGFKFYYGPDVSLIDDLKRRDLTINAIAYTKTGKIIDPFHGCRDLSLRIMQHISLSFKEDPLRILRLARLKAKLYNFSVNKETIRICSDESFLNELSTISVERIWREISIGLCENKPHLMFNLLDITGAIEFIMPEIILSKELLTYLSDLGENLSLPQRYAIMCVTNSNNINISKRLKVSKECLIYAALLFKIVLLMRKNNNLSSEDIVDIFEICDGFRQPERLFELLYASKVILKHIDICDWKRYYSVLKSINIQQIINQFNNNNIKIKEKIREKRISTLNSIIKSNNIH